MLTSVALFSANRVTRGSLSQAAERAGLAVIELDADPVSLVAVAGPTVAVRAPGGLVGAALSLGAEIRVHGPTAEWFVALSIEITGRTWQELNVAQARSLVERGPAFVKLADAKTPALPAARYTTVGDFDACIAGLGASDDLELLGTTGWLDIDSEYRVFTRERRALACSPYLIHDEPWTDLLHTHRASFHDQAAAFIADVLDRLPDGDVPPAAALDVARLHDGRYVLLEANQSWAAGPYGCTPDAVLEAVLAANDPSNDSRWRWTPATGIPWKPGG